MANKELANFLATDKVPESLFGIPIVASPEQYTQSDIEFFKSHPRAGGFYELGNENTDTQAAEGAGDFNSDLIDEATLNDENLKMHLFRNERGKVTSYGTTRSIVHENDGKFFVIPTILHDGDGGTRVVSDSDAVGWFNETGEHWGSYKTLAAADAAAEAVHNRHAKKFQPLWNEYIRNNWRSVDDSILPPDAYWKKIKAFVGKGKEKDLAKVFYTMTGELGLNPPGVTADEIINSHKARLQVHENHMNQRINNPANRDKSAFTRMSTLENDSHVLRKYAWGVGPGTNWFNTVKMEPRFDLINRNEKASKAAKALMETSARYLMGRLNMSDKIPSDVIYYGDGTDGLLDSAEEVSRKEIKLLPLPRGFKLGRDRKLKE